LNPRAIAPVVGERVFVERDVDEIDTVLDGSMIRCATKRAASQVGKSKVTLQGWNKGDT